MPISRQALGPAALLLLAACTVSTQRTEAERTRGLDAALRRYGRLVKAMASDSLAALYTPDGELVTAGQPTITGPDSIRAFLRRFDQYRVLASTMVVDSTRLRGDTGLQYGRYAERVRLPAGDTVESGGSFTAEWVVVHGGGWRLRRLGTVPLP